MNENPTPSAEILEKVKEIQKILEKYRAQTFSWDSEEKCASVMMKGGIETFVDLNEYHYAFCKLYNSFPSIASLCLEQAEEIERLRVALEGIAAMDAGKDSWGIACIPFEAKELAEQALSPSSHDN